MGIANGKVGLADFADEEPYALTFVEGEIATAGAKTIEDDRDIAFIAIRVDDIGGGDTFRRAGGLNTLGLLDRDFIKVVAPKLTEKNVEEPGP